MPMKINHGGCPPKQTPEFIILNAYMEMGFFVRLTTTKGEKIECSLISIEVEDYDTVVYLRENHPDDDLAATRSISIDNITEIFVH